MIPMSTSISFVPAVPWTSLLIRIFSQQFSEDDIIVPNVPENILWINNGNKYLNVPLSSHWSPYRRAANGDLYFWHRSEGGADAPEAQRDPNITRWQLVPASLRTQMEIALARAGLPISHDKKTAIDRNDATHDMALLKRFLNEGILTALPVWTIFQIF